MAQAAAAFNEDVFEEGDVEAPKNIHHIRANSSIMQLNKLLGTSHLLPFQRGPHDPPPRCEGLALPLAGAENRLNSCADDFRSTVANRGEIRKSTHPHPPRQGTHWARLTRDSYSCMSHILTATCRSIRCWLTHIYLRSRSLEQ